MNQLVSKVIQELKDKQEEIRLKHLEVKNIKSLFTNYNSLIEDCCNKFYPTSLPLYWRVQLINIEFDHLMWTCTVDSTRIHNNTESSCDIVFTLSTSEFELLNSLGSEVKKLDYLNSKISILILAELSA